MPGPVYDLAVIGGGIIGCSIARDAAGRGLSVFLCDQDDLGAGASSAATGLIHGDLRALERGELGEVRAALKERALLLRAAPHVVRPLEVVLPHGGGRGKGLLRAELLLYDRLAGRRTLPGARPVQLAGDPAGDPLRPGNRDGFILTEGWADGARLTVLTAMDARAHGAAIHPRVRCVIAERDGRSWRLSLESVETDERFSVTARALVNAAGPWAADALRHVIDAHRVPAVHQVKGSHVVVPRLFAHDRAYAFRNTDRPLVYAIPYEEDFTLIGTTEEDFRGDPADVAADSAEIAYLLVVLNGWLRQPVYEDQIIWSFSGIRTVPDRRASGITDPRHGLDLDHGEGRAPLVSIFGGSITGARRLAERVLGLLAPILPVGKSWTASAALPGGLFEARGLSDLARALRAAYPFVDEGLARRLARSYGTLAPSILAGARSAQDLGRTFGADLTEAEVRYLVREEWARTADDILWRRSKLGLRVGQPEVAALEDWLQETARGAYRTRAAGAGA